MFGMILVVGVLVAAITHPVPAAVVASILILGCQKVNYNK